jgi:hypothetical protein
MYAPNVFTLDVAGMMSGATDLSKYFIIKTCDQEEKESHIKR